MGRNKLHLMTAEKKFKNDIYYTPDEAVLPLLKYIEKDKIIWESAEGHGHISNLFFKNRYNVIGSDILSFEERGFTDANRNYKSYEKIDFLKDEIKDKYDVIITNPPYTIKDEFLERCYSIGKPFALLLPLTALSGIKRTALYRKYGLKLIIFDRRVNFLKPKKSASWFNTAWFCYKINLPLQLNFFELNRDGLNE